MRAETWRPSRGIRYCTPPKFWGSRTGPLASTGEIGVANRHLNPKDLDVELSSFSHSEAKWACVEESDAQTLGVTGRLASTGENGVANLHLNPKDFDVEFSSFSHNEATRACIEESGAQTLGVTGPLASTGENGVTNRHLNPKDFDVEFSSCSHNEATRACACRGIWCPNFGGHWTAGEHRRKWCRESAPESQGF